MSLGALLYSQKFQIRFHFNKYVWGRLAFLYTYANTGKSGFYLQQFIHMFNYDPYIL